MKDNEGTAQTAAVQMITLGKCTFATGERIVRTPYAVIEGMRALAKALAMKVIPGGTRDVDMGDTSRPGEVYGLRWCQLEIEDKYEVRTTYMERGSSIAMTVSCAEIHAVRGDTRIIHMLCSALRNICVSMCLV